jgi:hypothetical protein
LPKAQPEQYKDKEANKGIEKSKDFHNYSPVQIDSLLLTTIRKINPTNIPQGGGGSQAFNADLSRLKDTF